MDFYQEAEENEIGIKADQDEEVDELAGDVTDDGVEEEQQSEPVSECSYMH